MPYSFPFTTRLLSKLITATRAMDAATGDVSYVGVGFQPTVIIAMGNQIGGKPTTWAFSDSSLGEMGLFQLDVAGNFNATSTEFLALHEATGKLQYAVLKTLDPDGFTLTWTRVGVTAAGTGTLLFLCLR